MCVCVCVFICLISTLNIEFTIIARTDLSDN